MGDDDWEEKRQRRPVWGAKGGGPTLEELMPSPGAAKAFLIKKGILKVDEDEHSGLADSGCCGHELLQAGVDDTAFEAAQHDYGLKDAKRHKEAAVDYGRPAIVRIPEREAGAADDAGRGIPPPPSFLPPGPPMPEDPAPKHRKVGPEQLFG